MSTVEFVGQIPTWVDVGSVAVGSTAGALVAVRTDFDINGILLLSVVTGLGGSLIRDTLLQQGTPVALTSRWLLPTALIVGLIIFLFSKTIDTMHTRLANPIVVVDALFLAIYSIVGAAKGLRAGLPGVSCVFLGVITGVGGGILRDVLINEQPEVLRPGVLISLASLVGCTAYVLSVRALQLSRDLGLLWIVLIVAIRLTSVWRHWESPVATDIVQRGVIPNLRRRGRKSTLDSDD